MERGTRGGRGGKEASERGLKYKKENKIIGIEFL